MASNDGCCSAGAVTEAGSVSMLGASNAQALADSATAAVADSSMRYAHRLDQRAHPTNNAARNSSSGRFVATSRAVPLGDGRSQLTRPSPVKNTAASGPMASAPTTTSPGMQPPATVTRAAPTPASLCPAAAVPGSMPQAGMVLQTGTSGMVLQTGTSASRVVPGAMGSSAVTADVLRTMMPPASVAAPAPAASDGFTPTAPALPAVAASVLSAVEEAV